MKMLKGTTTCPECGYVNKLYFQEPDDYPSDYPNIIEVEEIKFRCAKCDARNVIPALDLEKV